MDVARIGLAHGSLSEAIERYRLIRQVAGEAGRVVGILVDLPGPKVRLGKFDDTGVDLPTGSTIVLRPGDGPSTASSLSVDYESLLSDVHPGDVLQIGDGAVRMRIVSVDAELAKAEITHGGRVRGRPGLHVPSDRLGLATPTAEDLYKLDAFVEEGVDMVAISFVRSAHDIRRIGTEPYPRGPLVVAKIETRAAVENLDGIIEVSGAVMVARGDLGMEMGIEDLPHIQKRIIRDCIAFGRPVITATQMLESMISAPSPTRAEVSDVANAIFEGADAVMLSAESAAGDYPEEAVSIMDRVAQKVENDASYHRNLDSDTQTPEPTTSDAITAAARQVAETLSAKAIVSYTTSGATARRASRQRPLVPILVLTPKVTTARQLAIRWGLHCVVTEDAHNFRDMVEGACKACVDEGFGRDGDRVVITAGVPFGRAGRTNTLRVVEIGEPPEWE
jgi:pyruvate kinase